MGFERELEVAKALAVEAGERILEIYETNFDVEYKDDDSPLTEADIASTEIIMDGLRKEFPDCGFLSEEEEDNPERLKKDMVWIVDPIDGTKEFIKRGGDFTINIGLVKDGNPVLGVVNAPAVDELYYAVDEAFLVSGGKERKIIVSGTEDIDSMYLVRSKSHPTQCIMELEKRFKGSKPLGSSLKGCIVARGDADVYIRYGTQSEWDICAMNAVINGAGGIMTDLRGNILKYNKKSPLVKGFAVSNNTVHEKILELIQ